jgi:DNA-binding LytR/AlgR family response regulator
MNDKEIPKEYGRIVFPGWENNVIENPDTIALIEGDDNCIKVRFKCGDIRSYSVCLKWILGKLDPCKFFRIHNRYIINGNFVTGYSPEGERYQVRFRQCEPLYVSRDRRDDFEAFIKPYLPDGYKRKKF